MNVRLSSIAICIALYAVSTAAQTNTFPASGNVGIGITNPPVSLDVQSTSGVWTGDGTSALTWFVSAGGTNYIESANYAFNASPLLVFSGYYTRPGTFAFVGNVGISTTTPQYPLDVAGTIRSSSGGVVFPDGTTQTTAFIPANCGADFAESVGVTGSPKKYEPGDLLVIDPNKPGKFLKSAEPYSTMVAGIYSTKPGFVGRLHPASDPASANEVPMAMVGRVPTKVTSENGSIKVGDLLVASSTPGYAMKGTDRNKMLGAVIGKALEPLDSGTGVITVLVTLQ